MMWNLPISVEIDGVEHKIRNNCDYRVVLDVFGVLNDDELDDTEKIICSLFIFYEDSNKIIDQEKAFVEMYKILNCGEEKTEEEDENKPKLMDWEHDFQQLAPPMNRVLGYSVRDPKNYTHWYDFIGAYMEIGSDCTFSTIVSIRSKRARGKKLEKHEEEFYRENKKLVDLPQKITKEEQEWLDSDW